METDKVHLHNEQFHHKPELDELREVPLVGGSPNIQRDPYPDLLQDRHDRLKRGFLYPHEERVLIESRHHPVPPEPKGVRAFLRSIIRRGDR